MNYMNKVEDPREAICFYLHFYEKIMAYICIKKQKKTQQCRSSSLFKLFVEDTVAESLNLKKGISNGECAGHIQTVSI